MVCGRWGWLYINRVGVEKVSRKNIGGRKGHFLRWDSKSINRSGNRSFSIC
jgi:hypothetical protein